MTYTLGIAVDVIVDMGCVCYAVEWSALIAIIIRWLSLSINFWLIPVPTV